MISFSLFGILRTIIDLDGSALSLRCSVRAATFFLNSSHSLNATVG